MEVQAQAAQIAPSPEGGEIRRAAFEAIGASLAMIVVVSAGIFGLWVSSRDSIHRNFQEYLIGIARAASTVVDPMLHDTIRDPRQINGPEYRRAVEPLRKLRRENPDIHYLYTMVADGSAIRFVLDAAEPASAGGKADQSGVWEEFHPKFAAIRIALGQGQTPGRAAALDAPVSDEWGSFMTGYAPMKDVTGRQFGIVGVDVDASIYLARLAACRNRAFVGLAPAGLLIGVIGYIFYRTRVRGLRDARESRKGAARLAAERERLSTVIEGTEVATWEWRADQRVIHTNERWTTLLGDSNGERQALVPSSMRKLVHPDDLIRIRAVIASTTDHAERPFAIEIRMLHRDGQWRWLLARGRVQRDATGRLSTAAGIAMDISERKAMENALLEAAQSDKLTGLPNRTMFMDGLERALDRLRAGELARFAVLFLDFDRFKMVNDTLGHQSGDELLRQIGERLRHAVRSRELCLAAGGGTLISRFGGDEFLVLVEGFAHSRDATAVAERMLNLLAPSYSIFGTEVHSMASIGIVTSDVSHSSAEEIVRNADLAMYEAKQAGRGCSVVFNESMHSRLTRHVAIETSLRRALAGNEFYLEYQPIVELDTGRPTSVEALIRWNHPAMGIISPNEFIPIAEESGLIVAVGEWVLEAACRQMQRWREAGAGRAPDMVSVNLSRAEVALGDRLLQRIQRVLQATELPASCLQLEITEREVMRDPGAAHTLLTKLHELGVRLAMDDFGTGNSSLALLHAYPFDTIKIDRSFLQDFDTSPQVLAVIHATISLIENLEMNSLAEGVEETAQVALLQSLGCRYAQGYLFSKPLAADKLVETVFESIRQTSAAHGLTNH